ncbi:MAG: efflux RND transporter permease subunit, partial [Bacteroidota bacterium]
MKSAILFLIQRPVAVLMSTLLIVVLALIAAFHTPVSLFPDLDVPRVVVRIANEDKSPAEFENAIVQQFRNHLLQLKGVDDIYSVSTETEAEITLKFDYGTQMDYALLQVNEKIDQVLPNLPDVVHPTITKYSLSDYPSLYLAVQPQGAHSPERFLEMSKFVEYGLKNQLEQLEAVSIADLSGVVGTYYQLNVNQRRIQSLGLNLQDITRTLEDSKVQVGTIALRQGDFVFDFNLDQLVGSLEDILQLRLGVEHRSLRLADLVNVRERIRPESTYLYNGQPAISIAVVKDPSAAYADFTAQVGEVIDHIRQQHPGLVVVNTEDHQLVLDNTIQNLLSSLVLGLIFALLSTLIFIRSFRIGLLLISCVGAALVVSFLFFYLAGVSFNLVSLTGLILGVGLMIDNAIIVIDNITQHSLGKKEPAEGIATGTAEVALPLLASGLTTCAIFFPLFMISGLAGVLFYDEALSIAFGLLSSYICSLTLLPTLFQLFFRQGIQKNFNPLAGWYHRTFAKAERYFKPIALVLMLLTAGGAYMGGFVALETAPEVEEEYLASKVYWNENISNETAQERLKVVLHTLAQKHGSELQSEIYLGRQDFYAQTKRKEVRNFEGLIYLRPNDVQQIPLLWQDLQKELLGAYPKARLRYLPPESMLATLLNEEAYDLQIIAPNEEQQQQVVGLLHTAFPELSLHYLAHNKGYQLQLDEQQLAIYQINRSALLDFVRYTLGGKSLYDLQRGKNSIPVLLNHELEKEAFLNTQYRTDAGDWVLLNQLVDLLPTLIPQGIETINNQRGYVLNVKTNAVPAEMIMEHIQAQPELATACRFSGKYERMAVLQQQSFLILVVIIVLLYLILAIQFNALSLPLIVLLEVPVCIGVSLLVLYASGQSLNIMSFIGILMMAGIIINDSILKIDLINQLRRNGASIDEAIHKAGERRLSSIIMTSMTTILAVSPMLFKNDLSAQLQIPLITPIIA